MNKHRFASKLLMSTHISSMHIYNHICTHAHTTKVSRNAFDPLIKHCSLPPFLGDENYFGKQAYSEPRNLHLVLNNQHCQEIKMLHSIFFIILHPPPRPSEKHK